MTKKGGDQDDNTRDKKARAEADKKLTNKQRATNRGDKNAAKGGKHADKEAESALRRFLRGL